MWQSDPVQHRVGDATQAVKQQAAPFVTEKLGDAMKAVEPADAELGPLDARDAPCISPRSCTAARTVCCTPT